MKILNHKNFLILLSGLLMAQLVAVPRAQACSSCELMVGAALDIQEPLTEQWIETDVWTNNLENALEAFADQMSAIAMQQVMAIGMFLDAKQQLETQRVLQTIRARAHKDYQPSAGMCEFGSSIKSLAASERKSEISAHMLSQRSQDRNSRSANTSAASAADGDQVNRMEQWKGQFCDPSDNNGGIGTACPTPGAAARMNVDIDYVAAIENPWTLNVDFTDTTLTNTESDLFALASNLYSFDVLKTVTQFNSDKAATGGTNDAQSNYLDGRALLAKRSVAENSFNAITSMKTAGTAGSRDFLEAILSDLGVSATAGPGGGDDDITRLLGSDGAGNEIGPSYYAQMEVLTKKIYQNPDFYTNLYDKPANVERKEVAMQAIGLMQKFDLFKSYLRTEASLSVLLETSIQDLQDKVQDQFANQPK
jgi:hypothetical protein